MSNKFSSSEVLDVDWVGVTEALGPGSDTQTKEGLSVTRVVGRVLRGAEVRRDHGVEIRGSYRPVSSVGDVRGMESQTGVMWCHSPGPDGTAVGRRGEER